ncbi:MAG: zinc-dependent alcohol dehydrogenase [Anaerolineae bacterium]
MKAAIVRELGAVALEDIPEPVPNEYQAVAKVLCWATCNSTDSRVVRGSMGWDTPLPTILGHETVGRVVAVGPKVRHYEVGDVLLRVTAVYPGTTMAGYSSALGSFTEIGLATDTDAMKEDGLDTTGMVITHFSHQKVPAAMDPADAAMIINLRESLSWIGQMGVEGKSVLVVGDGPVGQGFVQSASAGGAGQVIFAGHHEERLDVGHRVGADHVVNSRQVDLGAAVRAIAGADGVDVLIECTGDQRLLADCLSVVKADGKVAAYGSPKIPPTGPKPKDRRILRISTDEAGYHDQVLRLIEAGRINPRLFWSDRMPYTEIGEAIARIGARRTVGKVVMDL